MRPPRTLVETVGPHRPLWLAPVLVLWSAGVGTLLVGGFLVLAACQPEEAPTATPAAQAADGSAVQAVPAKGAPVPGPAVDLPSPPPPAPALNQYAEQCLTSELGGASAQLAATCMEHLLETLRAVIGYRELPQVEVGPKLDRAEVAVRRLGLGPTDDEAAALTRDTARQIVELATAVSAFVDGAPDEVLATAAAAADALDPEQPLGSQGTRLATFFRAADDVVRPLVRSLSGSPAASPAA